MTALGPLPNLWETKVKLQASGSAWPSLAIVGIWGNKLADRMPLSLSPSHHQVK